MAIAFVSLLVIVIVVIIGIPILARVFAEAARRGDDSESGEGRNTGSNEDQDN